MTDTVETKHAQYAENQPDWEMISDAVAGQKKVKERRERYLPRPNPSDKTDEANKRYDNYLLRAVYTNFVGRTHQGLLGIAFGSSPEMKMPAELEYLLKDADGMGVGLIGQAQLTLSGVMQRGRAGVLVDYPKAERAASRADMASGNVRATLSLYSAESIINWRKTKVGAKHVLSLVVLAEKHETPGAFESKVEDQYRVLRLGRLQGEGEAAPTRYVQEIWRKVEKDWQVVEAFAPLTGAGQPWTEIPFQFVGALNNDTDCDKPPLYDLACLNLAHYRNSADYEDATFLVGQPTPYITGLDVEWRDSLQKTGVYFGSRAVMSGPTGSSIGLLQAEPNTLVGQAMKDKEEAMVALGARLLKPGEALKTATQSDSDDTAAYSVLSLACDNVSEAYTKLLAWAAQFMNTAGETLFAIDTDFVADTIDAPALTAVVGAWQAGKLPDADGFAYLKRLGLIDPNKTDQEIRDELETQNPAPALDET